ncbi:MAG: TraR/DksA family transcriptional regulator [Chitinophagales bacterium]
MATNKKQASGPSKSVKPTSGAKKATPVKKAVANKPVKASAKPVAKKTAPAKKASPAKPVAKKATPVKKAPAKPIAKKAPAKKADPIKKHTTNHNQKTVNKKTSKPTPPARKAMPVKKKEAPAKKAAPVAKKAIVTKPTAKTPAKPVAKAPLKPVVKAAPAPKKAAPTPPPAAKTAIKPKKPVHSKKTLTGNQIPVKTGHPVPKPIATPAARSTEKKTNIIIAHRRLENKSKGHKGSGNTMTHYQPETYRSILDEPQQQQGPAYRYSDEDLNEFRDIITSRLEAARKELGYLQGLITRKDEAGTEDTENRYMNMEDGSGAMEREQLAQLASRQIQFMSHLEKALVRIENKTYGICRVTGKLIDKARLRAVPHATLSIEAKKLLAPKPQS